MPKIFEVEEQQRQQPVILLFADNLFAKNILLSEFAQNSKVIFVSDSKKDQELTLENIYLLNKNSVSLIEKIEEKIDYAVFFLQEEKDQKYFSQILTKFQQDQTKILLLISVQQITDCKNLIENFKNRKNIFFAIIGDLFGKNLPSNYSNLSSLLLHVRASKKIILSGNDLMPIFPIGEKDAAYGINQILFGKPRQNTIFFLFYNHPQTFLSLVHLLKRIEPELEVEISEDAKNNFEKSHDQIKQDFEQVYEIKVEYLEYFQDGFEKSLKDIWEQNPEISFQPKEDSTQKTAVQEDIKAEIPYYAGNIRSRRKKTSFIRFALLSIISSILLFWAVSIFSIALSTFSFGKLIASLKQGEIENLPGQIKRTGFFLKTAHPGIQFLKTAGLGKNQMLKDVFLLEEIFQAIEKSNVDKIFDLAKREEKNLPQIITNAYFLYSQVESISFSNTGFKSQLDNLTSQRSSQILSLLSILPEAAGFKREKNYLLLFQNDGELRPTGGFIGSVGELTVEKGKVKNFNIRDVYELDGQLKAHIEPHFVIRRFLQPHLYLRDSNFSLNFEKSASRSALVYNLETGKKVDGVIAINYNLIRHILQKTGPIDLPSYKKSIDENNAFEFIQETIESNFFPGSKQKKEVLTEIFNQLSNKLQDKKILYKVFSIIPNLIEQKDILFAFQEKHLGSIFAANSFSGNISDARKKENNTFNDYLAVFEANIGVNKANLNIKREIDYEASITNLQTISKLSLKLSNLGQKAVDYKSYIRLITPLRSKLLAIKIDGEEQVTTAFVTDFKIYEKPGFKPPKELELENTVEEGKQVFGFITTVPQNKEKVIELIYENGEKPDFSTLLDYSLLYIKQPGTQVFPLDIKIGYPASFRTSDPSIKTSDSTVFFQEEISKDQEFKQKFIRK